MNIVFMGTPDFAAVVLDHVARWAGQGAGQGAERRILGVYCQPDRPAGRGHKLREGEVKKRALALGLPVLQPANFKEAADREALAALCPDVLVVAAYGLLLPQAVLDIPRLGPFNVHGSLLPRYRGAAPIQRSLMNGDTVTGITIMRMEKGLDTGPMVLQRALGIGLDDTAGTLYAELADLGGRLMVEVLERLEQGEALPGIVQDAAQATHAAKLSRADGEVDFSLPVLTVHARLRGVTPAPGGRTTLRLADGNELAVLLEPGRMGQPYAAETQQPAPGTVLGLVPDEAATADNVGGAGGSALAIACADAPYLVRRLRPADRKLMDAAAFWNGYLRQGGSAVALLPHVAAPERAERNGV